MLVRETHLWCLHKRHKQILLVEVNEGVSLTLLSLSSEMQNGYRRGRVAKPFRKKSALLLMQKKYMYPKFVGELIARSVTLCFLADLYLIRIASEI